MVDATLFDQLQKVAETSTDPEIQIGALRLLAEFEEPSLVDVPWNTRSPEKFATQGRCHPAFHPP